MTESILTTVKKLLGMPEEYEHFDLDIITHINTVMIILYQMGLGKDGFSIADKEATWGDFLGEDKNLNLVKSYVAAKVRLMFDPPTSSVLMEAMNNNIKELEWRIYSTVDNKK